MRFLPIPFLVICWFLSRSALAQPAYFDELPPSATSDNAWLGIAILGNPTINFTTASDYTTGVTLNHATLQLSLLQSLQWSLQVRATGDLQSGSQSIPISALTIQPVNITGSTAVITLSTAAQTLATGQLSLGQTLLPTFRYKAQGGNAFLKPAGHYTTTLVFSYTAL